MSGTGAAPNARAYCFWDGPADLDLHAHVDGGR
jgi:hypothetical protein